MTKDYNDIPHIEAYLRGEMDAADRQAFEAQLVSNEKMKAEVAAYRLIFNGLKEIKFEQFAAEAAIWAQEARQKSGTSVMPLPQAEAREGSKIISINRGTALRHLYRRVAVAAGIVLVLGMAVAWWGTQQYSDEKLLSAAYVEPLAGGTMGGETPEMSSLEKQYEQAHQDFKNRRYAEASAQFAAFIEGMENNPGSFDALTRKSMLDNARWTALLAQFAAGQISDAQMLKALESFAGDPTSEYASRAQLFQNNLKSYWRKLSD